MGLNVLSAIHGMSTIVGFHYICWSWGTHFSSWLLMLLQPVTGYLGLALVFMWGSALRERFNLFFKSFLLALTKFSNWRVDWALGYHSMGFMHSPDVS